MIQQEPKIDLSKWILSAGIAAALGIIIPNDFLQPAMRAPGAIVLTILHAQQLSLILSNIFDIVSVILTALIITFPLRIKNSLAIGSGVLALAIPAIMLLLCDNRCPDFGNDLWAVALPLYGIAVAGIYIIRKHMELGLWRSAIVVGFIPALIFAGLSLLTTNVSILILYTFPLLYSILPFVPGALLLAFAITSRRIKN